VVSSFQTALVQHFKDKGFTNVKDYFGEFTRPSDAKIFKTFLPGIMVDFVESSPQSQYRDEVTFSLYVVHATYSKQEAVRTQGDISLLEFIHAIREAIFLTSLDGSDPIRIKRIKKIFDDAKEGMYLTVYQMALSTTLNYQQKEENW